MEILSSPCRKKTKVCMLVGTNDGMRQNKPSIFDITSEQARLRSLCARARPRSDRPRHAHSLSMLSWMVSRADTDNIISANTHSQTWNPSDILMASRKSTVRPLSSRHPNDEASKDVHASSRSAATARAHASQMSGLESYG
jgi:hypothetical protein